MSEYLPERNVSDLEEAELFFIGKVRICVHVLSLGIEHKIRTVLANMFLVSAYLSFSE